VSHGGDFLLEIIHSPFSTVIPGNAGWFNSDYGRVPNLLLHASEDASEFERCYPNQGIKRDGISYLLQLTRDVKQNPVRLTHLLVQMAKTDLKFNDPICAVDLGDIVEVAKKYCLGYGSTSHVRYSHDLAAIISRWRDRLAEGWKTSPEVPEYATREMIEPEEMRKRCIQVIHGLVAPRVTRFGLQASRLIACARPVVPADAATGWLRMYL
jgi:hypothetical protein